MIELSKTTWELWLDDPVGVRLAPLERIISAKITWVANEVGSFQIVLPGDFDNTLAREDGLVEFWRAPQGGGLRLRGLGRVRTRIFTEDNDGNDLLVLTGPDHKDLLRTRRIPYAAGSAYTTKTDYLDDMMKAVMRENLGSLATDTDRDLSALGFSVAGDLSQAPSKTKSFAYRNVLDVLKDLAKTSLEDGTRLYFELDPVLGDTIGFLFRTNIGQPGIDRTDSGLVFGKKWGNVASARLEENAEGEETFIYAAGQGEEDEREIQTASDTARIGASPWNRREGFIDARNEATAAGVLAKAAEELARRRKRDLFSCEILDTDDARFGVDWDFGDMLTFEHAVREFEGAVLLGTLSMDEEGVEHIEARVEVES